MPDLLDALMLVAGHASFKKSCAETGLDALISRPLDDCCLSGCFSSQLALVARVKANSKTTKDGLARPHFKVLVKSRR